jgi:CBS domain-containing protein
MDVVAEVQAEFHHPVVVAVVVQKGSGEILVPYSSLAVLLAPAIPLKCRYGEVSSYYPKEESIFLARDVLDKQIIDTDGARVIRVNDLELLRVSGKVVVSNVDVGGLGILRRIGLAGAAKGLTGRLHVKAPESYIAWDHVELLRYDQSMRLKTPREKLTQLHPADIAEIISDLNRAESGHILEALDVEHLADMLEEVEPDFQASLVEDMPDERVADLLEEMEPDEAADLLAELPPDRSHDLLALMEKDEADDVIKLLSYPEDSAGGIMTTEYAVVPPSITAAQAIEVLRQASDEAETIFYIYVADDSNHLVGMFSLRALIFAQPETPVEDFMVKRVVSVDLLDSQEQVAQVISKYDLLAVPVVDENNILHGIVTADDALDKIIPTAWKKRLPRFFR